MNILTRLDNEHRPLFYHEELHMIDFSAFNRTNPIYIGNIRDPVERFRSRFAWARLNWAFRSAAQFVVQQKILNILYTHCSINVCVLYNLVFSFTAFKEFGDFEPILVSGNMSHEDLFNQNLNDCVLSGSRACNPRHWDRVDHPLVSFSVLFMV